MDHQQTYLCGTKCLILDVQVTSFDMLILSSKYDNWKGEWFIIQFLILLFLKLEINLQEYCENESVRRFRIRCFYQFFGSAFELYYQEKYSFMLSNGTTYPYVYNSSNIKDLLLGTETFLSRNFEEVYAIYTHTYTIRKFCSRFAFQIEAFENFDCLKRLKI